MEHLSFVASDCNLQQAGRTWWTGIVDLVRLFTAIIACHDGEYQIAITTVSGEEDKEQRTRGRSTDNNQGAPYYLLKDEAIKLEDSIRTEETYSDVDIAIEDDHRTVDMIILIMTTNIIFPNKRYTFNQLFIFNQQQIENEQLREQDFQDVLSDPGERPPKRESAT
jgi:hypothetical protein